MEAFVRLLPLGDDAQEAVVEDLDGVDVKQPLRGVDPAEVDGVSHGPHCPRSPHLRGRYASRQGRTITNLVVSSGYSTPPRSFMRCVGCQGFIAAGQDSPRLFWND